LFFIQPQRFAKFCHGFRVPLVLGMHLTQQGMHPGILGIAFAGSLQRCLGVFPITQQYCGLTQCQVRRREGGQHFQGLFCHGLRRPDLCLRIAWKNLTAFLQVHHHLVHGIIGRHVAACPQEIQADLQRFFRPVVVFNYPHCQSAECFLVQRHPLPGAGKILHCRIRQPVCLADFTAQQVCPPQHFLLRCSQIGYGGQFSNHLVCQFECLVVLPASVQFLSAGKQVLVLVQPAQNPLAFPLPQDLVGIPFQRNRLVCHVSLPHDGCQLLPGNHREEDPQQVRQDHHFQEPSAKGHQHGQESLVPPLPPGCIKQKIDCGIEQQEIQDPSHGIIQPYHPCPACSQCFIDQPAGNQGNPGVALPQEYKNSSPKRGKKCQDVESCVVFIPGADEFHNQCQNGNSKRCQTDPQGC